MQGNQGWEGVLEVLRAQLLEAVQRLAAVVFGRALVLLACTRQLHTLLL